MSDSRSVFANSRVAEIALKGQVDAPNFLAPTQMQVIESVANIRKTPGAKGLERQVVFGAAVDVLETHDGWSFGRDVQSGYVGYFENSALGPYSEPSHFVCCRASFGFREADIKSPVVTNFSFGSRVNAVSNLGDLSELHNGIFVPTNHLRRLSQNFSDPVSVAEKFFGTPYLWGGNSAFGIDCSGLVQASLQACGHACPGDSDQQLSLGVEVDLAQVRRGDLLFWRGHVAMVAGESQIIHANAHHMAVQYEDLNAALLRIEHRGDSPFIGARRLAV